MHEPWDAPVGNDGSLCASAGDLYITLEYRPFCTGFDTDILPNPLWQISHLNGFSEVSEVL